MGGRVLITDAQMRSSLAVIRSLGKKGLKITAGEETRFATGFFSKYVKERVVYPSPRKNQEDFVKFLRAIVSKNSYEMLIPVADATLLPIMKNKDELEEYTIIPYPDYEKFTKAYDKGEVIKLAQKLKTAVPNTYFVQDSEELEMLAKEITYPAILKARFSFEALLSWWQGLFNPGNRCGNICDNWDSIVYCGINAERAGKNGEGVKSACMLP